MTKKPDKADEKVASLDTVIWKTKDEASRARVVREYVASLKSFRTGDDTLKYSLAFVKTETFPTDRVFIHGAMKRVKDEVPELMEDYVFYDIHGQPYSPFLDRALTRLEMSSVIEMLNPRAALYRMSTKAKKELQARAIRLFNEEQVDGLRQAARAVEQQLGKWSQANGP